MCQIVAKIFLKHVQTGNYVVKRNASKENECHSCCTFYCKTW
ncbi:unnamed protein product [Tenebrio molitor]|nr:unnamed protein product [Tenebrio molitor]